MKLETMQSEFQKHTRFYPGMSAETMYRLAMKDPRIVEAYENAENIRKFVEAICDEEFFMTEFYAYAGKCFDWRIPIKSTGYIHVALFCLSDPEGTMNLTPSMRYSHGAADVYTCDQDGINIDYFDYIGEINGKFKVSTYAPFEDSHGDELLLEGKYYIYAHGTDIVFRHITEPGCIKSRYDD